MAFYRRRYPKTAPKPVTNPPGLASAIASVAACPLLSAWESDFMASISEFYKKRSGLTEGQLKHFRKIEKNYDAAAMKVISDWNKNFTAEMRRRFYIAVEHYSRGCYYSSIVLAAKKNESDPNYVPSKSAYEKLTDNKYIKTVFASMDKPPKFNKGDLVKFRATAKHYPDVSRPGWLAIVTNAVKNGLVIVTEVDPFVSASTARNCRVMKVHSLTDGKTYYTEERFLKKAPKK